MTYNNCCQCFKKRDFEINTASNKRHIGNVKSCIFESNNTVLVEYIIPVNLSLS